MPASKREPGRPAGSGVDLSQHLEFMAVEICRRAYRGPNRAATEALKAFGAKVTLRHLLRVYAARRLELEVGAMRDLGRWNIRMALHGIQPIGGNAWEALWKRAAHAIEGDPELAELAASTGPSLPMHRWYPVELMRFLRAAGLEPPE